MRLGGGGSYGATNWAGMSVADMWLAVGNQETSKHWELLTGWRKSYELTQQHMAAVKAYRENLAVAWPPEKSPAAAAYVARLDDLIANLQQTYDAAVTNYSAFNGATMALSSARRDLEKVVNEYAANEGKIASFEQAMANRPVAAGKSVLPPLKRPVADGRQIELEKQARSIMYGLSAEIVQARAQVVKPSKFDPGRHISGSNAEHNEVTYSASPIPAVTPFAPDRALSATRTNPAAKNNESLIQPGSDLAKGTQQPGLVLGGVNEPGAAPAPPTVIAPATTSQTPGPGVSPMPLMPQVTPKTPTSAKVLPVPSRGLTSPTGQPVPVAAPSTRGAPPGAVIGAMPGNGLIQPSAGTRPPPTANPVGGVLGQSGQGTGRTTAPQATNLPGQMLSPAVQREGGRRNSSEGGARWQPDNPWRTLNGVEPVILPPPVQRVDVGPAIGLN